ncbi:endocytosis defective- protein [Boothiomyces macroporosus]|uniref:Endocytosis defective- protein n=1 Tax=Boothiomyces macroporosus TaxID=261099 RepID=A0AAD5UKK1_9FUNG|nr:endocytosis defective- protein [Boothiomyces macroporosus]
MSFDWYLSPADRFSYETQFNKYSKQDIVTLQDLDPLFQTSRISTQEFIQIWQLVDIRFEQRIQKIQFVYFMHILTSRRRGKQIPTGLPLSVKEEFLKEPVISDNVYTRPSTNVRDVGQSSNKSIQELQNELEQLIVQSGASKNEAELAKQRLDELHQVEQEVVGLYNYYVGQIGAVQVEIELLGENKIDLDTVRESVDGLKRDYEALLLLKSVIGQ